MTRTVRLALALLAAAVATGCSVGPSLLTSPLEFTPVNAGRLVAGERPLTIVVKDERPADEILAGGILGPKGEKGEGIYLGYVPPKREDVAAHVEAAAREAATVLGFSPGAAGGHTLEITIQSFRIDLYRTGGFSPMNCAGYGRLAVALRSPAGETLREKKLPVAFYENTSPAMSMKEVTREAVSRIYALAGWEATSELLVPELHLKADPQALGGFLDAMDRDRNEIANRRRAYWLGVLGKDDPRAREKLVAVFRTSKDPRYREGAVEALGRMGATEVRDDIVAILAGRAVGDWKTNDAEQTWYLLKALWMMGGTEIASVAPPEERGMTRPRKQIADQVAFLTTGELPPLSDRVREDLAKARQNVKR